MLERPLQNPMPFPACPSGNGICFSGALFACKVQGRTQEVCAPTGFQSRKQARARWPRKGRDPGLMEGRALAASSCTQVVYTGWRFKAGTRGFSTCGPSATIKLDVEVLGGGDGIWALPFWAEVLKASPLRRWEFVAREDH